jgi:hypothetical protein
MLKSVTTDSQQWTVKVRAVRFSEYATEDNPPKVFRLDMVLLDEKVRGTRVFYTFLSHGCTVQLFDSLLTVSLPTANNVSRVPCDMRRLQLTNDGMITTTGNQLMC